MTKIRAMTRDELLAKLKELRLNGDIERAHGEADDLLEEFVRGFDKEIAKAYHAIDKWYA